MLNYSTNFILVSNYQLLSLILLFIHNYHQTVKINYVTNALQHQLVKKNVSHADKTFINIKTDVLNHVQTVIQNISNI